MMMFWIIGIMSVAVIGFALWEEYERTRFWEWHSRGGSLWVRVRNSWFGVRIWRLFCGRNLDFHPTPDKVLTGEVWAWRCWWAIRKIQKQIPFRLSEVVGFKIRRVGLGLQGFKWKYEIKVEVQYGIRDAFYGSQGGLDSLTHVLTVIREELGIEVDDSDFERIKGLSKELDNFQTEVYRKMYERGIEGK